MAWSHDNSSGGERRENLIYALALPGLTNFLVFLVAAPPKPALSATPLRSCCGGGTSADAPASSVIAASRRMLQYVAVVVCSNAADEREQCVRLSWLLHALVCQHTSSHGLLFRSIIQSFLYIQFKNPQQQVPAP